MPGQPFGVELPQNFGQESNPAAHDAGGGAYEGAPGGGAPAGAAPEGGAPNTVSEPTSTQTPTAAQLLDLDKHEKFLWKGREITRKEFEDGHLRQSDYSKKTAELTEQRKFADNFDADLQKVMADPDKWLSRFERVYPPGYVKIAKTILERHKAGGAPNAGAAPNNDPAKVSSLKDHPEFQALSSKIEDWERSQQETQIEASRAWLKSQHDVLGKKYPHAHPEVVEGRLGMWAMKNGGDKVTGEVVEQFYQKANEEMKQRSDALYKDKITKQITAGKEARDVGTGGDAPGAAPKRAKSMKEATQQALDDIANGTFGRR